MKFIYSGLLAFLLIPCAFGKPGGTYTLTGNEKSIRAIIKADAIKYPDLYKGESFNTYLAEFKRINQIGRKKLAPGDVLVFPETMASRKAKQAMTTADAKKAEEERRAEEAGEKEKQKARQDGIYDFQHRFLPRLTHQSGGQFFLDLESGLPSSLINKATELVDSDFAQSLQLKSYPGKNLYVILFEQPARPSHCYYAALKTEDTGCSYYTLEKGINLFGAGDISVLCMWEKDGTHVNLGGRTYDDLGSFLSDIEEIHLSRLHNRKPEQ